MRVPAGSWAGRPRSEAGASGPLSSPAAHPHARVVAAAEQDVDLVVMDGTGDGRDSFRRPPCTSAREGTTVAGLEVDGASPPMAIVIGGTREDWRGRREDPRPAAAELKRPPATAPPGARRGRSWWGTSPRSDRTPGLSDPIPHVDLSVRAVRLADDPGTDLFTVGERALVDPAARRNPDHPVPLRLGVHQESGARLRRLVTPDPLKRSPSLSQAPTALPAPGHARVWLEARIPDVAPWLPGDLLPARRASCLAGARFLGVEPRPTAL